MEKKCAKKTTQNVLFVTAIILASVALSLCVLACILLPYSIAYADSTQNVLIAPVSNLEGNAYAVASTLKLTHGDDTFVIPESYYVCNVSEKTVVPQYYQVTYCGFDFYYNAQERPTTTSVTFADGVSPYPDVRLTIKDGSLTLSDAQITSEHTVKFLGYHPTDSTQIYVVATLDGESVFGFAAIDSFESFVVPYHPIAQAEREQIINAKPAPDTDKGDIIPNTSLALRIILIIGIAVPAVVIAILLFKPSKHAQGKSVMRNERRKGDFDYDSARAYNGERYDERRDNSAQNRDDYRQNRNDSNGNSNGYCSDERYSQGYDSRPDDRYNR